MTNVVFGHEDVLVPWAAERMPLQNATFGPCTTLGFAIGDRLISVAIFHNFRELQYGHEIHVSMSAEDPRWCTRRNLGLIFKYPFDQLGCVRVTTVTSRKNKRARKLDEGLGFKREGVLRKGMDGRDDAIVYGMLRKECKWIRE
jgi:RimJ/RimL family protein N-acetyltransferase